VQQRGSGYATAAVLVVATVGVLLYVVLARSGPGAPSDEQLKQLRSASEAAGCSLASFPTEGRAHTTSHVTYKTNPPTSGAHNPAPAPDRVYTVAPPAGNYVHSLEHGRIELQYRPGVSPEVRAAVLGVYKESPDHVLVFPNNTRMPYEVAATAWKHRLGCTRYNGLVPEALSAFRDAYRDHAPEQVP
jgi:hypothetical protein